MRDALQAYVDRHEHVIPERVGMLEGEAEFDSTNVKTWLRETWKPE
jgi:hypothetical protein